MKKVGYICRTHICKLPHQNHWYGVFLIFVSFYFQELNASKQKELEAIQELETQREIVKELQQELAENQRAVQAEQVVIISSLFDQFTVVFLYSDEP
jgi:hypothetical protein